MTDYGISAALRTGLRLFEISSRRSGRTSAMLQAVRPGDRIITSSEREQRRLLRLLNDMGKKNVEVQWSEPKRDPRYHFGTQPKGRTVFDHNWIEGFFKSRVEQAVDDLTILRNALSKEQDFEMDAHPSTSLRNLIEFDAMGPR